MLHAIAKKFAEQQEEIETFFKEKSQGLLPPLYLSCDIRSSGKKLAVVDTNLFPAGFNNLCNAYSRATAAAFRRYFEKYFPGRKKILLLIEEHTRNRFYLENVRSLKRLLEKAELTVQIAFTGEEITGESLEVTLSDGEVLSMKKLQTGNGTPQVQGFEADLILSNNDFSRGVPEILLPVMDKVLPSPHLGWHRRSKRRHFIFLKELIDSFAHALDLDPWLLSTILSFVENLDLNQGNDLKRLSATVERVLGEVQKKYSQYQITDAPYVFVKNDSGTYGMGLLEVMQAEEILQMNRRTRNKLLSAKGGKKVTNFLIQEGIPTADFYSDLPIEPVIYMVGWDVVGGFFRMNAEADAFGSLNTRGMAFSCLCLHKLDEPHEREFLNCAEKESLVRLASVMARIAALAAAREMVE